MKGIEYIHHLTRIAAAALLFGCSAVSNQSSSGPAVAQTFELAGSRIIGCCCASPCPCRLNKKPMHCHGCDHTDAVHVDSGHIGKTDMSGVTWVIVGRGFGEKTDENWTYVYVSDNATPEQFDAIKNMLTSDVKSWGPKAEHLAGNFVGMRKVPIQYEIANKRNDFNCVIPGILELRTRAIYNPGHLEPVVSTGIMDAFGDRFVHAQCLAHKLDDPAIHYSWDLTGRQCNQADFVLNDERARKGGIGWGCWTAHTSFGDSERYQEQMIGHSH